MEGSTMLFMGKSTEIYLRYRSGLIYHLVMTNIAMENPWIMENPRFINLVI
jgi:hypothetical protein